MRPIRATLNVDTPPRPWSSPMTDQANRPLLCLKCGAHVVITEDITGYLDWGLAVLSDDGVVRREEADCEPRVIMADTSQSVGRPRACCVNPDCGYQWRLRRPFDPSMPEGARR